MELALLILSLLLTTSHAIPVRDIQGNELKRGKKYYILPAIFGPTGGGLKLVSLNETCPLYVARENSEVARGLPVMFFPEDPDLSTLHQGATFYAMFAKPTDCPQSTVWRLKKNALTTGGTVSSTSGPHDSRFAIRKADNLSDFAYIIQYCTCSAVVERPSCRRGCSQLDLVPSVLFMRAEEV